MKVDTRGIGKKKLHKTTSQHPVKSGKQRI